MYRGISHHMLRYDNNNKNGIEHKLAIVASKLETPFIHFARPILCLQYLLNKVQRKGNNTIYIYCLFLIFNSTHSSLVKLGIHIYNP